MIINIKGSNKDYRKLIESAAHYYAEKLVGKRLLKTIKININLRQGMLKKNDVEIHARSIFLQGLFYLSDRKLNKYFQDSTSIIKRIKLLAKKANLHLSELSLLWVCSLKQIDKVLIGIDNVAQLKAQLKTVKKNIDPSIFNEAILLKYDNPDLLDPSKWN